ncbi:MAG: cytochrome P450 [Gammaproteobacteria bacterium]|nr:cytochrome P450 [Gammaproteobacteria bacterium]
MAFPVVETLRSAAVDLLLLPERWRSGFAYNPFSPKTAQDPYPAYAELRSRAPVYRSRLLQGWILTRHADVNAILRDHRRFGSDPRKGTIPARRRAMLPPAEEYTMLMLDPPDHTRLRALVNKAFTPRAVAALESRIRGTLTALLDEITDPAAFDLMDCVARPLPVIVIAEMLGVPPEDRAMFRSWSAKRARLLEPTIGIREWRGGKTAGQAFDAYFRRVIRERRDSPQDDIVSALLRAQDEGARLSDRETLNMLRLLLAAGNETTVNLIGNGVLALLRHPEQLERLRGDPGLIAGAVEELLRFDSPVQADFRRVLVDCEVDGHSLRQRENVVLLLGAANRDPELFQDPDRLDVGRHARQHVSFGRGIHHCLGAPLARLEGRIALEMLLERFRSIELAGDLPRFRPGVVLRGLESLPVRCVPA